MDKEVLEKYKKAGEIAGRAKILAKKEIKSGVKSLDLVERIENFIKKEANLAFPVNLSINDIAAHCTPDINDQTELKDGDMVKLDLGAQIDGYIADTSVCVKIGENSDPLIKASQDALDSFINELSPGKTIAELSTLVNEVIVSHGFNPVRNLAGHSLDQYTQHGRISIPNNKSTLQYQFKEDDAIAMEVFATNGEGWVVESSPTLIFMFSKPDAVRIRESKLVLQHITENYKTLPFAKRWLKDICNPLSLHMALKELTTKRIIMEYPPLREKAHGIVSQSEETLIVKDKPIVTTKI